MRSGNLYLVDTSAWLEVLPRGAPPSELRGRIEELLAANLVAITGIVRLELLGAISNEVEYRQRAELLAALHPLPTTEERWDEAARLGAHLRRQGVTIPSTDLLIASVAMAAEAVVVHRDHHFDLVAAHAPLAVESHLPAASG